VLASASSSLRMTAVFGRSFLIVVAETPAGSDPSSLEVEALLTVLIGVAAPELLCCWLEARLASRPSRLTAEGACGCWWCSAAASSSP
jgi:hypothetical protein